MKINVLLLSLFLFGGGIAAQTTLQVVTKTVQRNLRWKTGYAVEINCEKAEVEVDAAPANQSEVSVTAELTARHPSLDTARADLEAWKFVTSTVGKTIYIRAYIGLANNRPLPTSNLKARLVVRVPPDCALVLSNKFGKARLAKISAPVRLSGEFCAFTLSELKGSVQVESQYGNVEGAQLQGAVQVRAKRADVRLSGLQNDCSVRSEYGAVRVESSPQLGNLDVQATKSDVTVDAPPPYRHNFALRALHGQLVLPLSLQLDPSAVLKDRELSLQLGANRPTFSIQTDFGKITVR